jgi:hypothetical protein
MSDLLERIFSKTFTLHMTISHKNKTFKCQNCELEFGLKGGFEKHIKAAH